MKISEVLDYIRQAATTSCIDSAKSNDGEWWFGCPEITNKGSLILVFHHFKPGVDYGEPDAVKKFMVSLEEVKS